MEAKMNEFIWAEKYRPTTLDELIIEESVKRNLKSYITDNQIPNLILYSSHPGNGKTSLAKILINQLSCDSLEINASDENSIDIMRTKVKTFCSTMSFEPLKIVVMSEADGLTQQAQASLKDIIEEYNLNCRFIFTLNNIGKIIDPILSRCIQIEFKNLPKEFIKKRLIYILKEEKIQYDEKILDFVIKIHYPDFRQTINVIQNHCYEGKLNLSPEEALKSDVKLMIIGMLANKKSFNEIFEYVKKQTIRDYQSIMRELFDKAEMFSLKGKEATNLLLISESMYRDSIVIDHEVNFMSLVLRLLENNVDYGIVVQQGLNLTVGERK